MQPTPGPWKQLTLDGGVYINPDRPTGESALIAKAIGPKAEVNGRLIAKSPELLSALQNIVEIAGHRWRSLPADSPEKKALNAARALTKDFLN
jgi:hypothetical protein